MEVEEQRVEKERRDWEEEKKKVAEIQTIEEAVLDLDVGGGLISVSRALLCQNKGSALEAMFSGRHVLPRRHNGRVFIQRNPEAFQLMIDYVANCGQLHEK